VQTTGLR